MTEEQQQQQQQQHHRHQQQHTKNHTKLAARCFISQFRHRFGQNGPRFSMCPMEELIDMHMEATVRHIERKMPVVYLQAGFSSRAYLFCSEVLCSRPVIQYLDDHCNLVGWDIAEEGMRTRVRMAFARIVPQAFYPDSPVYNLTSEELPVMLVLTLTMFGWEILAMIRGGSNEREVLECLQEAKKLFEAQEEINEQRADEDLPASLHWGYMHLIQLGGQDTQKALKGVEGIWGCPLSLEYERELTEMLKDSRLKKDMEWKKEQEWIKVVTAAVLSGEESAILSALASADGSDLSVCVTMPNNMSQKSSLLTLAASAGHTNLLPLLLAAGLSVEGHGTSKWTPLLYSAIQGHRGTVEALLRHGASAQAKNDEGQTPLHVACQHGHGSCVALLLPVTPFNLRDNTGSTPVHAACSGGHFEVVLQLAGAGWGLHDIDSRGNSSLHMAAWRGCTDLVKYLVHADLSLDFKNEEDKTPLDLAVERGNHEVETWLRKHAKEGKTQHSLRRQLQPVSLKETLDLIRQQKLTDARTFDKYILAYRNKNLQNLRDLLERNDPHLVDEEGRTFLHFLAEKLEDSFIAQILDTTHPHTWNYAGQTPLHVAKKMLTDPNLSSFTKEGAEETLTSLGRHRCPQMEGTPRQLYEQLLSVITTGDDWRQVSRLLCAGTPLELAGDLPSSALRLAVTNDRPRIVSLLLACGASLTHSSHGLNLLQQAWHSHDTTARVHRTILTAFLSQLKREKQRLPRTRVKDLREDLRQLIEAVDGEEPWAARWPECRSVAKMTSFMSAAARVNCPLVASFLRWAGAWPFFGVDRGGATPLHAAIQAGHLTLAEALVRDLEASLYTPDAAGRLPRDMHQLTPGLLARLEELMYQRERGRLEALKERQKDEGEKKKAEAVLSLQEALFTQHKEGQMASPGEVFEEVGVKALLMACRDGLPQLLHLLLVVGGVPPDTVLDPVCGTTALHEAAAHGKSGCVAHLLRSLQAAAATNASNAAAIAAAADPADVKDWRPDRYSPLQPDRYGQTAQHLAAMFGHGHTLELLQHGAGRDPPCRAGTTAREVHDNFVGYLRRYRRYDDSPREAPSPASQREPRETLQRLLRGVDVRRLPGDAWRANVDFDDEEGEAAQVRRAVLRAVGVVLGGAGYMPGRRVKLRLVGSARDGSRLFAPDEFDVNVVVQAAGSVRVTVCRADPTQGHPCVLEVETEEPELRGPQLAEGLQRAVGEALTHAVLDDPRLSVVPPGLTSTQVGMALSLAWQGKQYPLLLVGVDLVPVLEVPWHRDIERPFLTPLGAAAMHLSATRGESGSWRCSFAQLEAEVLGGLAPEQRLVQLCAKLLLASLKAERWMPRRVKALSTWWCGRAWTVPVPGGFCLKSCLFRLLEKWRQEGCWWGQDDAILGLMEVFEAMSPDGETDEWRPQQIKAYFGGDFEKAKDSANALFILHHLRKATTRRQRCLQGLGTLRRWWWRRLAGRWWWWRRQLAGLWGLWCEVQQQGQTAPATTLLIVHTLLAECWQRL